VGVNNLQNNCDTAWLRGG